MRYLFKKKTNAVIVSVFDALGSVCAWPFGARRKKIGRNFKSVLLIRMDHLGDVVFCAPVPKIIKENISNTRVIFLTSSWAAPLFDNNPFVDEVLIFDAPWFSKKRYERRNHGQFFKLVRMLRDRRIDIAVGFRGDLRENLIMALSGIKERVGYGVTGGGFLLTEEVAYEHGAHQSAHLMRLLKAIGIQAPALRPQIYFSKEESDAFEKRLEALQLHNHPSWVGFQVGAGSEAKEWPKENALAFLEAFGKHFKGRQIVLVGSDREKAKNILAAHPQSKFIDMVGKTSLRELCLLMKKFKLFIGHDSGPTHLAAALGVPTVFLYSGTNVFEEWRPLLEEAVVLKKSVPCSPCGLSVCNVKGHPCLSGITPEEVMTAVGNINV